MTKRISFDGYIIHTLMRDLVGHEKKPSAFVVFIHLWSRTAGMRERVVEASLQEIADDTGLSKSAVQAGLRLLRRRRLVRSVRDLHTSKPRHYVLRPWHRKTRGRKTTAAAR
jgi:DNA-binding MarR family transcriptional regulator